MLNGFHPRRLRGRSGICRLVREPSTVAWCLGVIGCSSAWWSALQAQPLPESVQPVLYCTGLALAEGPCFDDQGNFYVVNYRQRGTIGRITPDGAASIFVDLHARHYLAPATRAHGLKVDKDGYLIAAAKQHLLRISPDGRQVITLANSHEGRPFTFLNDCALDLQGNIYFTDSGYYVDPRGGGSVYRYAIQSKEVMLLDTQLAYPNGLGVTPDGRYFCLNEGMNQRILIYDLQPDGSIANRRVLIQFPETHPDGSRGGEPDGMIFDTQGRLYTAMHSHAREGVVNVVEVPSGRLLRTYSAGGGRATNVHFYGRSLYVTSALKEAVFRLDLGVEGFDYNGP